MNINNSHCPSPTVTGNKVIYCICGGGTLSVLFYYFPQDFPFSSNICMFMRQNHKALPYVNRNFTSITLRQHCDNKVCVHPLLGVTLVRHCQFSTRGPLTKKISSHVIFYRFNSDIKSMLLEIDETNFKCYLQYFSSTVGLPGLKLVPTLPTLKPDRV